MKVLLAFAQEHVSPRERQEKNASEGTMILVQAESAQVLKAAMYVRIMEERSQTAHSPILGNMRHMSVDLIGSVRMIGVKVEMLAAVDDAGRREKITHLAMVAMVTRVKVDVVKGMICVQIRMEDSQRVCTVVLTVSVNHTTA